MKAMKVRNIFSALLVSLFALASCEQMPMKKHCDIRQPKELNVMNQEYNVGWEGETLDLSFTTNSFWGVEFLGWKVEIRNEGDTARVVAKAGWMSTPVIYGEGNANLKIKVAANDRTRFPREGFIKVFTGDENVAKIIPVHQEGNPTYEGPEGLQPMDLVFDFTNNNMNWPTANETGRYDYTLDGVAYTFELGASRFGGSYLVVNNVASYVGMPAIEGYKLTRITVLISSNNKSERGAVISSDTAGADVVSENQLWPAQPSIEMIYDIEDPAYDTMYYMVSTKSGLPVAGITLHYEP